MLFCGTKLVYLWILKTIRTFEQILNSISPTPLVEIYQEQIQVDEPDGTQQKSLISNVAHTLPVLHCSPSM